MISKSPTSIDEYIADFPEDDSISAESSQINHQTGLRLTLKNLLAMECPRIKLTGDLWFIFAAFKNHIGFYATPTGHMPSLPKSFQNTNKEKGLCSFQLINPCH